VMSYGLIILVTFVLVILGVHIWCRFSELQDEAHARRQVAARQSLRRYRHHGAGLAESRISMAAATGIPPERPLLLGRR
jgi:hypothetical protein